MRNVLSMIAISLVMVSVPALAASLEPIPGSITYKGQPRTKLTKSPIGSTFNHYFTVGGYDYAETYRILPDRSLEIISRRRSDMFNFGGRGR
ncbi:hypothetical protein [Pararhizobium capsulatum]|nr:hypothetical protein [Pararhizobium capsulatum]